MSNREIVQQGLNARKDVRAAEARAEKFREEAAGQRDARFYDRMKWRVVAKDWQQERLTLLQQVNDYRRLTRILTEERDELIRREQEAFKLQTLTGAVKTIGLVILTTVARDAGWIVPGLAGAIAVAAAAHLIYAIFKLTRKK